MASRQGRHTQNSDVKAGVTGACEGQATRQQDSQTAHVWKGRSSSQQWRPVEMWGHRFAVWEEERELFKGQWLLFQHSTQYTVLKDGNALPLAIICSDMGRGSGSGISR